MPLLRSQQAAEPVAPSSCCVSCSLLINGPLVECSSFLPLFERLLCKWHLFPPCSDTAALTALSSPPLPSTTHARVHSTAQTQHPHPLLRRCAWVRVRCTRSPLHSEGRSRGHPEMARAVGRHACLSAGAASLGQTTHTQQSGDQPTRACSPPRRQPCASSSALHHTPPCNQGEDRKGTLPSHFASLWQGAAGSEAETQQEENSG